MKQRFFHVVPALLLALVQAALLLHESDIAAHANDSENCEICLVGQGLGHALSDIGYAPAIVSHTRLRATPSTPVIPIVRYCAFSPRAPPAHRFS